MLKTTKKFSKGFGILEVLISSAIIIVVLGTLVFIAQSSLTNAAYMQERAQAVSLAAEGIETIRQNRDSNNIDGIEATKWNTVGDKSDLAINYDTAYYIPVVFTDRFRITTSVPVPTKIDGVDYTRKIFFINTANMPDPQLLTSPVDVSNKGTNGFEVMVEVKWRGSGGKSGRVELRELITNSRFVY
jgi:type II secretory pathway pseudopilin PulG